MLRVQETLKISIPREGLDVNRLEEALAEAFGEFEKRVMDRALEEMEKGVLSHGIPQGKEEQGKVAKKGKRSKYLCTRFGWIRFARQRVRYLEEGRYGFPLDEALGLGPHQQESNWVRKRGVELACPTGSRRGDHPYRQAAELLAREIGEELSHRTLHRWVQGEGRELRREEEVQRQRVFEEGDTLEEEGEEREIVVVEVDGTMLSSQEKRGEHFEMKLGLMYTGKELESKEAKWKRYRLKEKVVFPTGSWREWGRGGRRGLWGESLPVPRDPVGKGRGKVEDCKGQEPAFHWRWSEMDQRDSRGRLLEERLSTGLVALSEEVEADSPGRREANREADQASAGRERGGAPPSAEVEAHDGPGRGREGR